MTVNTSYFVVLDKVCSPVFPFNAVTLLYQETVARSNTVALDFGRALMGPVGALIFAGMVAFSCFGALNGMLNLFVSAETKSLVI